MSTGTSHVTGWGAAERRCPTSSRGALGLFFLGRLRRLADLRARWAVCLTTPPPKLLDRALYSTYLDCLDLGLRAEARRLLGLPENEGRSG